MNMKKVNIRKSKRAKQLRLSVHMDGRAELVVPWRVSYKAAERFLAEKQAWLQEALARHSVLRQDMPVRQYVTGETVPCFDCAYTLDVEYDRTRQRSHIQANGLTLNVKGKDKEMVRLALVSWYKKEAQNYFTVRSHDFAEILGVTIQTIAISGAKTQWGSCKESTGRLSFNWKLLLAPADIADYVVAHEVAHMKHQNHSPDFWDVVESLMPDYKERRTWLKKNGYTLVL